MSNYSNYQLDSLITQVQEKKASCQDLTEGLFFDELLACLTDNKDELTDLHQTVKDLEFDLDDKDQEIHNLEDEVEELEAKVERLEDEVAELETELENEDEDD